MAADSGEIQIGPLSMMVLEARKFTASVCPTKSSKQHVRFNEGSAVITLIPSIYKL
jgi:hypothetical protein